jgi:hypothetical protein
MGAVQSAHYSIVVKFPRGHHTIRAEDAPEIIAKRFPGTKRLTLVTVGLAPEAHVKVGRFGMPFANSEDPEVEGWVNSNAPIVSGVTLLDFLRWRTFRFVVTVSAGALDKEWNEKTLPLPFSYPWGTEHHWPVGEDGATDLSQYAKLMEETKSAEQFRPAYRSVIRVHLTSLASHQSGS